MPSKRARGELCARRMRRAWLVLPLALGCGDGDATPWVGSQDCSVGIPPEDVPELLVEAVRSSLSDTRIAPTGDGFFIQNLTFGPIAGFSCEAWRVNARYVDAVRTPASAARPALARPIELDPFECRAGDGRRYTLDGKGEADLRAVFINTTFSAWLQAGQRATLTCTTRFLRQSAAPDAGLEPSSSLPDLAPFDPAPGGSDPGNGSQTSPDPLEMAPDAGATETLDPAAAPPG